MTRRKPAAAGPQSGPQSGQQSAGEPELLELDAAQSLLDDLAQGDDGEVCVYRCAGGQNTRDVYLFVIQANALGLPQLLDKLRDEYDGGAFRLRGRKGSRWHGGSKTIYVEAPKRQAVAVQQQQGEGMPPLYQMMLDAQRRSDEMLRLMLENLRQPPPAQQQLGFADVIRAAELMKGGGGGGSPVSAMRELLEVQALMDERRGGGDGVPDWGSIAKLALPIVQQAAAAVAQAPATAPAAAPAAVAAPAPDPRAAQLAFVRRLVARLVKAAQKDSDPEAYAIVVIDEIGEESAAQLLAAPDPVALLVQLVPEAEPVRAWLGEFVDAARDQLKPEEPTEPAP